MSDAKTSLIPGGLHTALRRVAAKGLEDHASDECAELLDIYHAIAKSVDVEIKRRGLGGISLIRRQWWLVHQLNSTLCGDGVTGLMYNDPGLINPAIESLAPLNLPRTMEMLTYARAIIPSTLSPDKPSKAYRKWVEAEMTEQDAERLNELCEKAEPYTDGSLRFCAELALAHPSEFFAAT